MRAGLSRSAPEFRDKADRRSPPLCESPHTRPVARRRSKQSASARRPEIRPQLFRELHEADWPWNRAGSVLFIAAVVHTDAGLLRALIRADLATVDLAVAHDAL